MTVQVLSRTVGEYQTNAYVIVCNRTGASVLVEPGDEAEALADLLDGSHPVAIAVTHSHPDHVGALADMRRRLAVPVLASPGPYDEGVDLPVDVVLAEADAIPFGQCRLRVRRAPGHLPDELCFEIVGTNWVVVGDTVFEGGPGHTETPEAFRQTLVTLRTVVLALPDDTVCLPGHGQPFVLGRIRADIEAFVARDHGAFCGDAVWQPVD